jgi:hypothetical protein
MDHMNVAVITIIIILAWMMAELEQWSQNKKHHKQVMDRMMDQKQKESDRRTRLVMEVGERERVMREERYLGLKGDE